MSNIFLSYVRDDAEIARRIVNDLRALGTSVWLDDESIVPGENWQTAIYRAIERTDAILVLISPSSLGSNWVEQEWRTALAQQNKRVIPALVGGATPADLPRLLQEYQAVDLNRSYEAGLRRIHAAVERLDASTAPTVVESINVAQIVNDVTRRVLQELASSPNTSTDGEMLDEKLIFVICSFRPDMEPAFEAIAAAAAANGFRA